MFSSYKDLSGGIMTTDQYCFHGGKSCVPDTAIYEDVPKNNNVYKVIRARSWWFCGKYNSILLLIHLSVRS